MRTRLFASAALLALLLSVSSAAATLGELPIDTCLTVTNPELCVNYEDAEGRYWFLADFDGPIHPDLPPLPFPEGTTFRVTGHYCTDCIQVFCGSFYGFIVDAALMPCLEGDVNGDLHVDFADVLELISSWGACGAMEACPADQDRDGSVTFADLLVVLGNWSGS